MEMRTGAARGLVGCSHEAGFYGSDAEFRALIVPFAEEGIAAGEPVIIGYDDRKSGLLRSWLSDPSAVEFIAGKDLYATPGRAIAAYRRLFEFHRAMGAGRIRAAGDVPHPGNGGRFEGWDRYECAINTAWQDLPVWALCLYDTATAPAAVLDVVGHDRHASAFQGLAVAPDPLEQSAPVLELADSSPASARDAVTQVGHGRVPGAVLDDLLIGTSEVISNALQHGRPPAVIRIWAAADRVVVHVRDSGPGPADPLAGLLPPVTGAADPGLGLWLVHQLNIDVALIRGGGGFTVRLRAGTITG
jgi:anti-sigma regulatory factor (Ser/Thr protein kinase)